MPRLADGFVSELKEKVDLYDLISRYVQLKKSGSSWVGLSPFNQEKRPLFIVHPHKGFFNCFSSGEKAMVSPLFKKWKTWIFMKRLNIFLVNSISPPFSKRVIVI